MNKEIFVSAYSMKERDENVKKQTNDDFKMPKHAIYQIDYNLENSKKIFEKNWDIRSIMINGEKITSLCEEEYNNSKEPTIIYEYNIKTGLSSTDT